MAPDSVLTLIDAEIARFAQVRSLLAHAGKIAAKIIAIRTRIKQRKARKPRVLSPEARQRIADAQRKHWAAQRAKA